MAEAETLFGIYKCLSILFLHTMHNVHDLGTMDVHMAVQVGGWRGFFFLYIGHYLTIKADHWSFKCNIAHLLAEVLQGSRD